MSDEDSHVTRRELKVATELLLSKMESNDRRNLLYFGAALGVLKFNVPDPVTAGVILVASAKVAIGFLLRT